MQRLQSWILLSAVHYFVRIMRKWIVHRDWILDEQWPAPPRHRSDPLQCVHGRHILPSLDDSVRRVQSRQLHGVCCLHQRRCQSERVAGHWCHSLRRMRGGILFSSVNECLPSMCRRVVHSIWGIVEQRESESGRWGIRVQHVRSRILLLDVNDSVRCMQPRLLHRISRFNHQRKCPSHCRRNALQCMQG